MSELREKIARVLFDHGLDTEWTPAKGQCLGDAADAVLDIPEIATALALHAREELAAETTRLKL